MSKSIARPPSPTVEEMEQFIARFAELKSFKPKGADGKDPEGVPASYLNETLMVLGTGKRDPALEHLIKPQSIADRHPFVMSIVRMEPGGGVAPHTHMTGEYFMPLNGPLRMFWGPSAEETRQVTLNQWDVLSLQSGEMRWFDNPNDEPLLILAIIPLSPGRSPDVELRADVADLAEKLSTVEMDQPA